MPDNLRGKVAVITGGSSGIGLASVEAFVAEGARVMIGDLRDELGAELADRLGDAARYLHTDVSDDAQVAALVEAAVREFGRLDVMFNNAFGGGDPSPLIDLGPEGLDQTLRIAVGSVVSGHRHAAAQFRRQGSGGSIITTSSGAGLQGGWGQPAYAIGKTAVLGVVREAAAAFGPDGIRSNAICPGITMTPLMAMGIARDRKAEFVEFLAERVADQQPAGRPGRPEDIAGAAVFLASDLSAFVNGAVLPVDGGASAVTMGQFTQLAAQARADFT